MTTLTFLKKFSMVMAGAAVIALGTGTSARAALLTTPTDSELLGSKVIDFETAPLGSFNSLTLGDVTFSTTSGRLAYISDLYSGEWNAQGKSLQSSYENDVTFTALKIDFANPVTAFGFNWGAPDELWSLTAFDSAGNVLDSQDLPVHGGGNDGHFFGIKNATAPISYATLVQKSYLGADIGEEVDYVLMDNFKYSSLSQPIPSQPVPEATSTLGVLAIGAFGAGSLLKRKQEQKI